MKIAKLFLNSDIDVKDIPECYTVCADGGYYIAQKYGFKPDLLLGDFDSLDLSKLDLSNVEVIKYPVEKDFSDGEAAILELSKRGFDKVLIYGVANGRLDHIAVNLKLLKIADDFGLNAVAFDNNTKICYLKSKKDLEFATKKDDIISIIPYGSQCFVEKGDGLYYKAPVKITDKYASLGLSNVATGKKVKIRLKSGSAYIFHTKS